MANRSDGGVIAFRGFVALFVAPWRSALVLQPGEMSNEQLSVGLFRELIRCGVGGGWEI
jgi:hypothetical protein